MLSSTRDLDLDPFTIANPTPNAFPSIIQEGQASQAISQPEQHSQAEVSNKLC